MKKYTLSLLVVILLFTAKIVFALDEFKEGKDYERAPKEITHNDLVKSLLKEANGKVQVLEFFSYGCHWCYQLDPYIEKFSRNLPQNVNFQRVPVEFQPAWRTLGKAYYAAKDLNALDNVHGPLFEAINSEKITNTSPDNIRTFFISRGIEPKAFDSAFDSFDVNRKQKWALSLAKAYRITAIPVIIVQGPAGVFITSTKMAGTEADLIKVVDYLTKKAMIGSKGQETAKK